MATAIEWPMAHAPDPPAPLVAAWLAMLKIDGGHTETHEGAETVPWVVENHQGYVVQMCHCGHWYIVGRGNTPPSCGAHG